MSVSLAELWLPILLSAIAVFIASSLVHMVIGWHNSDYTKLPNEDAVTGALEAGGVKPGVYIFPCAEDPADNMKSPEIMEKWQRGPAGMLTLFRPGPLNMGKRLGHWFLYCVAIGLLAGYVGAATVAPGASFGEVMQIVATTAFLGYAGSIWQNVIWMGASPRSALKSIADGLVYALCTGAVFGLMWP